MSYHYQDATADVPVNILHLLKAKHSAKKTRKALCKQLCYVARDIRYLEQFMSDGYAMTGREIQHYLMVIILYEQQQYMYDNKVHSVKHRIMSISRPWIRPIVRRKIKVPVEFGQDLILDLTVKDKDISKRYHSKHTARACA